MKYLLGLTLIIGISLAAIAGIKSNSSDQSQEDIFTAIRSIDYISINILLSDGVDVDTVDQQGNTPLMVAANVGNPRIMDIVLSHNPQINKKNNDGTTALMIAAKTGQLHAVKDLTAHDADLSLRDNNRNTALTLASKYGHTEIVHFLQDLQPQPRVM
jgi:ankyrin repeat protein